MNEEQVASSECESYINLNILNYAYMAISNMSSIFSFLLNELLLLIANFISIDFRDETLSNSLVIGFTQCETIFSTLENL